MHFHEEPSWSSCSSMYILTLWSWSNWYQYMRPSLSRPIGWRRMVSASSSLIMFLNLRLSSNWHSQRYWKIVKTWLKIPHYLNVVCLNTELIQRWEQKKICIVYPSFTILSPLLYNLFRISNLKRYYFKLLLKFTGLILSMTQKSYYISKAPCTSLPNFITYKIFNDSFY